MNDSNATKLKGQVPRSITLTMRQGPGPGQRFNVTQDQASIGRSQDNDVFIADQQISRHHATITWETNQFVIRDLNSANGTTVNGVTLTAPCPLRDGDVIGLGDVLLTFQGTTGITDYGSETTVRPGGSSVPHQPVTPMQHPPTIAMPQPAKKGGSTSLIVGIGAAIVLGFVVVAGLFFFFTTRSESQTGPKITVQQPAAGSQAQMGQPVTILASIKDPKGVTRVELWDGNTLEATIASSVPGGQQELLIQHEWTPKSSGTHTLVMKAYNSQNETGQPFSTVINVMGNEPPGTPGSTPAVSPSGTTQAPPECTNNASFVADVTIPDNSAFPPGTRIDKTWRLRNTGTCPWQTGYQLAFVSGDKMGGPDSQAVVPTAPGGTTDLTVTMYAPNSPGTYKGVWRMVSTTGQQFGQNITILIQVPSPHTPTSTITPTSPPPPGPEVQLTVDNTTINAGQCTTVRASVQNVSAAWLDGDPVVGGYKEKQVCPCNDTTYNLEAVPPSGPHIFRNITVNVNGVCPADKPDLVIKDLEADNTEPVKGNPINLKMRIKNEGNSVASNFAAAWRPFGPSTSTWIIVADNITLNPGEDKWINWNYTYADAGTYDSKSTVDYLNNVDEGNEGNNHRNLTINVKSLLVPNPGILTAIAPGPILPINPGILTAIAPTPTSHFQINPGLLLTAVAPGFATIVIPGP